jgi:hypothetical protein
MSNLEVWNKVCQPPKTALKQIKGGRLSGMTDINPQWRLQVMTEIYGQCGIGWFYKIINMWPVDGAQGEVMAFVHLELFTRFENGWSAPITGIGGSALVAKETSGLRANDEAYKMATTDALSVAMKQLGVGADIYMGRWDGTKYTVPLQDGPGVHKPTANELYKPDEATLRKLSGIIDRINSGELDFAGMSKFLEAENLDSDEKVWVWDKLDSKTRSGIKKYNEENKVKK